MDTEMLTRDAYGKALIELGKTNENIIVLDSDLSLSTRTAWFGREFPERFFNFGIAEANMVSAAAGLASCGKIVFASSFAMFATGRAYNQFRTVVAYPKLNVKLVASHGGLSVGEDGPTHQCIEDIAIMRVLPHTTVVVPADAIETEVAIRTCVEHVGPLYMRLGRPAVPLIYGKGYTWRETPLTFKIGESVTLKDGGDVAIMATGLMVSKALTAADMLVKDGIKASVINVHTIKPLDERGITQAAKESGAVVTAEEHTILGGLGSAIAEVLLETYPVPMIKVGINDSFCESGSPEKLLVKYGLTVSNIVSATKKVVKRKK
jgi:transketolase